MRKNVSNFIYAKTESNYNYYGNYYYTDSLRSVFLDSMSSKIYETSQNAVILLAFSAGNNTLSPALKVKDCDIKNNGSLVVYTLN